MSEQLAVDGLLSQLDAHRESLSESLNQNLNLRTNVFLLKKQHSKLTEEVNALKKQLEDANKKISELESAQVVVPPDGA